MEAQAEAQGRRWRRLDLDAQEALWQHAKAAEKREDALFLLTALAEIGLLSALVVAAQGRQRVWLLLPAAASLALFAWLLTLHPTASGRVYAAYGGVYIGTALFWLWLVDGIRPSRWDLFGAALCLAGMAVIMFGPRAPSV
jgi:small multidrug resistance family-3 protein